MSGICLGSIVPQGYVTPESSICQGDMPMESWVVSMASAMLWDAREEPRKFGNRYLHMLELSPIQWGQLRICRDFGGLFRPDIPDDAPYSVRGILFADVLIKLRFDLPTEINKNSVKIHVARVVGRNNWVEIRTS